MITDTLGRFVADVARYAGQAIVDGGDGACQTSPDDDDVAVDCTPTGSPGRILITAGVDGRLDTDPMGDDFSAALHTVRPNCVLSGDAEATFASDPRNPDTDGDGFLDGAEASFGGNPNDALDAAKFRDTDADGLSDRAELDGFLTFVNGVETRMTSSPTAPDSDFDGLPDLLEWRIFSNPRDEDTDGDGLSDANEFNEEDVCLPTSTAGACDTTTFKLGFFVNDCNLAPSCNFVPSAFEAEPGTNLNAIDTDADGLADVDEIEGYPLTVRTALTTEQRLVTPNPRIPDTDGDGVSDEREALGGPSLDDPGDATMQDTDGDGFVDAREATRFARRMAVAEVEVEVRFLRYDMDPSSGCDTGLFAGSEILFRFRSGLASMSDDDLSTADTLTIPFTAFDGDATVPIDDTTPLTVVVPVGDVLDHGARVSFTDLDGELQETRFRGICPRSFDTLDSSPSLDVSCELADGGESEISNNGQDFLSRCVNGDEIEVDMRIVVP